MTPPELMFFLNRSRRSLRERLWLSRRMRKLDREVRANGWTAVPFQMPGDEAPRFFYTVGFDETLGQPELILFDQPAVAALEELDTAFQQLRTGELTLRDGMPWAQDDQGRCVAREVHPERVAGGWLGLARERRRALTGDADGLRAFQLVCTDKSGRLPWEAGYDERLRHLQPALWEPPSPSADGP